MTTEIAALSTAIKQQQVDAQVAIRTLKISQDQQSQVAQLIEQVVQSTAAAIDPNKGANFDAHA